MCDRKLYSGKYGPMSAVDSIFKPEARPPLADDQDKIYHRNVYMFHIAIVTPLLLWISYNKDILNPNLYPLLGVLGVGTGMYHGYRLLEILKGK